MRTHLDTLLELAMCSLPTGLFICDRDGIIQFINEAYASYLRIRPEEATGRHITELIPDSRIPAVIASGEPELGAWRQLHSGETNLLVNRIPLHGPKGDVVGAVSMTLFDTPEQMKTLLQQVETLDRKVHSYARRIKSALTPNYTLDSILGKSPAIMQFKSYLQCYAKTDSPVLILGATGTGKELAASAIHTSSNRPEGPFVSINCAAIPKELFESEVFGYMPGAFSGAHKDGKVGQIELADQGTLFLDEVGDLPLHAQVKLLRVLEEKRLCRLGSTRPRSVDFRLVAATNRDLKEMIAAGTFREDLYYRINPMTLVLPPLRERTEDIPLLVRNILDRMGGEDVQCTEGAMSVLLRHSWPGNIRELRNIIIRALSLCKNRQITSADFPQEMRHTFSPPAESGKLQHIVRDNEARIILAALNENGWNIARTARSLGISRANIYEKMNRFNIKRSKPTE